MKKVSQLRIRSERGARLCVAIGIAAALSLSACASGPFGAAAANDYYSPMSPKGHAFALINSLGKTTPMGYGWALSASAEGEYAAVTAPFQTDKAGGRHGTLYFFEKGNEHPLFDIRNKKGRDDMLGASVALSKDGEMFVYGSPGLVPSMRSQVNICFKPESGWDTTDFSDHDFSISGSPGEKWGASVAIAGDKSAFFVGSPGEAGGGRVYYYEEPESGWDSFDPGSDKLSTGYLGAGKLGSKAGFGSRVAVSGDGNLVAISAPGADGDKGAVYVFIKPAGGWTATKGMVKVQPKDLSPGDRFGESVAVSEDGSVISVGAPGMGEGKGRVFVLTGFNEGKSGVISFGGSTGQRGFGCASDVSSDGKTIAVSSYGVNDMGAVNVYTSKDDWDKIDTSLTRALASKEGADSGALFGFSLDLLDDGSGFYAGAPLLNNGRGVYLFIGLGD
jgi:hypothetical protein